MAEKIITVTVAPSGEMTVEASGFKGKGCMAATKAFESMGKVKSENTKPEYFQNGPSGSTVASGH